MNKYQPVIGLEVHVELNTKTKMFCSCFADYFGKEPNTHTCPVCLGLPGALPFINEEAIKSCMKIGLSLNCSVSDLSRFERKNYFYPDLPKGYQISQYRWPLSVKGFLEVINAQGEKTKIRINRVHQEEDTAKLVHQFGNQTYVDFNRSGVPLVEIVTEPDFHDSASVRDYAKKLQQIFRYLGVSNADMEKGDMRLEANVSLRELNSDELPPYRIELKNINSFRFMVNAIEYEIKRQAEALDRGEKLVQETRGWDSQKGVTYLQRSKEEAHDYRYFPDPDLPEVKNQRSTLRLRSGREIKDQKIETELPELPNKKVSRFVSQYGISEASAVTLTEERSLAEFFEKAVLEGKNIEPKQIANYIINQKLDIDKLKPGEIIEAIKSQKSGVIDDEEELERLAREVIQENPQIVEMYKKGKVTVIMALVGGVMKKTAGKANAVKAREILEKLLS